MGRSPRGRQHGLAETAAKYAAERETTAHTKLSISLPRDLVAQIRAAAAESETTVSGVIAAALRGSIVTSEQERIDRALAMDAEDNAGWANDALSLTARAWADLQW
jgi:hypothetical protein